MPLFVYFGDFSLRMCSFDHYNNRSKSITPYLNSAQLFSYTDTVISGRGTVFGVFCDYNVCACAVIELILLPVVNLSPEMDLATPISYRTGTF